MASSVDLAPSAAEPSPHDRRQADLALLGATVLWSTSFALIKDAMVEVSPILLSGIRFAITCLVMWPILLRTPSDRRAWLDGIRLGVTLFCCFAAQVTGLRTTSAGNSAFVTATCTLMVPFVDYAVRRRKPGGPTLIGVVVAMAGVYAMVNPTLGAINRGDLWTLVAAACYAIYLVDLDGTVRKRPYQIVLYSQLLTAAVLGFLTSPLLETPHFAPSWRSAGSIAVVALGATAAALYIQNRFQRLTTPTRAALIFTAEPIFASIFAYLVLGEVLAPRAYVGGAFIIGGILLSELL